jgi:hypothetical protein
MKKLLMAFAVICSVSALHAEPDYYASLCAWAPGQLPMSSRSVIWGVRGTLFYGDHSYLSGLDLALGANRTREQFYGLAIAGVYNRANAAAGTQIGGANFVENEFYGLQIAKFFNYATMAEGVQIGGANIVWTDFYGTQLGRWNIVWNEMCGAQYGAWWNHAGFGYGTQWGVVNTAGYFAGLQLGLFNWADDLDGLQLGLINVVADQTLCVLPFLNIGF